MLRVLGVLCRLNVPRVLGMLLRVCGYMCNVMGMLGVRMLCVRVSSSIMHHRTQGLMLLLV